MYNSVKVIKDTIRSLELDLKGLTIITECGTNSYLFTPLIPCLAGADVVKVVIKDLPEKSALEILSDFKELISNFSFQSKIEFFLNPIDYSFFNDVDIITNSGMLRPLDESKLSNCTKKVAIPLMYEKWEFRNTDIDLAYCQSSNFKVGGVWENHPKLKIFEFCENLIIKMIFDSGMEIRENKFIIFSSDDFGKVAMRGIQSLGGSVLYLGLEKAEIYNAIETADALLFCDYMNTDNLIGDAVSYLSAKKIKRINPNLSIIHLSGNINSENLISMQFKVFPEINGRAVRMSKTLDYLGSVPVIKLLTAGIKVGEEMSREKYTLITQLIN